MNQFMHHHRLQRVNSPQLFVVSEPVIQHLKSAMSLRVIRIFPGISSLQGYSLIIGAKNRWGSMSYLDLTEEDLDAAQKEIDQPQAKLGQWVLSEYMPFLP
jgi:hypothetical protein